MWNRKISGKCFAVIFALLILAGFKATKVKSDSSCICTVTKDFFQSLKQRSNHAVTGTQFMQQTEGFDFSERQYGAVQEILAGNMPEGLRIPAILILVNDHGDTLQLPISRDYLAIGSDTDFVRIPLSLPSAKAIAKYFNVLIPTPTLVDAIYEQANIQLKPQPMHPGDEMRSNAYYLRHNELINEQAGITQFPSILLAGHKKDVVISTRVLTQPKKVPIYGWHLRSNEPIQPLSLVHGESYEDYSHGLRLIASVGCLNGRPAVIEKLFNDPAWETSLGGEAGLAPKSLLEAP
jgi:hypothetical protein